ncbi:PH domain-containing protein [Paenibacillus senegalensis]|uniref:PH domain-containing protein n=1 Tax=Paenibacillus senegalensis TaxID=1465766 RepID=UPI000288C9FF|nr:PH domain-containing protein [Paenibacillus senegalensis]
MNTQFRFDSTEVVLSFSGLAAITGFKRKLAIPYATIMSVQTGPFQERVSALPTGGVSLPFYRTGRFFHNGKRTFMAFSKRHSVLILELAPSSLYQRIVVETEKPEQIKQQLTARCPHLS